jgi:hypothetical protein
MMLQLIALPLYLEKQEGGELRGPFLHLSISSTHLYIYHIWARQNACIHCLNWHFKLVLTSGPACFLAPIPPSSFIYIFIYQELPASFMVLSIINPIQLPIIASTTSNFWLANGSFLLAGSIYLLKSMMPYTPV